MNYLWGNIFLKFRLGFIYRNRSSFTPAAKLTVIQMTILPMLDYGDVIYRLANKGALERLDVLYHPAIRFDTNAHYRTHHCTLYSSVNGSSLNTRRKTHWLMLIYKTPLDLTPPYLRYLLQPSSSTYNPRSASHILLKVPKAHTPLGHSSIQFAAARDWTELQQTLKLDSFISISSFKDSIMETLTDSCGCFVCCIVVSTFLSFVLLSVLNNDCTMFCAATMLCCYHVVLSCVAALLCCCLRSLM